MRWSAVLLLWGCTNGKDTAPEGGDSGAGGDTGVVEDTEFEDISALLESMRDRHDLPSVSAAVMSGDNVIAQGVTGVRKVGDGAPAEASDRYFLGSGSRAMTAALMGVLVEEGTIGWDRALSVVFPSLSLHPDYEDVTLSMLLLHEGGAWSDLSAHPKAWETLSKGAGSRAAFAAEMLSQPPEYTPGGSWAESDAGYVVVGAAMEEVTGRAWEDLVAEKVFDPLGMNSCGFGAPDDGSVSAPWGHDDKRVPVEPAAVDAASPAALGPAGTIHCDMADWGRFAAAHLAGARGESEWLTADTFRRLHAVGSQSHAMGWVVTERTWAKGAAFSHTGDSSAFYSVIWLAPQLDRAWLVSTNTSDGQDGTDAVLNLLIKAYAE